MTTLTELSITTRKTIRYFIFGVIALILGKFLINSTIKIYRYFFPVPPPPPTVTFGKLPAIPFPKGESFEGLSFNLETANGEFPVFSDQAKVYYMPRPSATLLSLDKAIEKATKLGYDSTPEELSQTLYRFQHKTAPSVLEYNITLDSFSISYDLTKDATPLERIPVAPDIALATVKSFLTTGEFLPEDLSGITTHQYLKISEGELIPALGQSDADFIKINLFRKEYDELPTVTARGKEANVWFMLTGARERARQVVAAEFHHFPVDEGNFSTYPIKTAEAAWEELKEGKGYIVSTPKDATSITVRNIYLAYYDPNVAADFLQPVVVFEGDGDFVAYVPAVTADYYGE